MYMHSPRQMRFKLELVQCIGHANQMRPVDRFVFLSITQRTLLGSSLPVAIGMEAEALGLPVSRLGLRPLSGGPHRWPGQPGGDLHARSGDKPILCKVKYKSDGDFSSDCILGTECHGRSRWYSECPPSRR